MHHSLFLALLLACMHAHRQREQATLEKTRRVENQLIERIELARGNVISEYEDRLKWAELRAQTKLVKAQNESWQQRQDLENE